MKLSLASFALSFLATPSTLMPTFHAPVADSPKFYLVATSSNPSLNLLPVRINGRLSGADAIAQFYFYQGALMVYNAIGPNPYRPFINATPTGTGCTTYGFLNFVVGSSTNKCAKYSPFQLKSDPQDSQLGAQLVFNNAGGFYACNGPAIIYKVSENDGPSGCHPVSLYTVPVPEDV